MSDVLLRLPLTLGTSVPHDHVDTAEHHCEQVVQVNPTPAGPSSSMRSLNPALPADPRLTSALIIFTLEIN